MSLFRITSHSGETLAAAQSVDGLAYVVGRHFSPGRYDVVLISEETPPSDPGGWPWGAVVRHDDGQVSLEPRGAAGQASRTVHSIEPGGRF